MKKFQSNSRTRSTTARLYRWLEANIDENNLYVLYNDVVVVVDVPTVVEDEYGHPVGYHFHVGCGVVEKFDGAELRDLDSVYVVYFDEDKGRWTLNSCSRYDSKGESSSKVSAELFEELWDIFKAEVISWEEEQQKAFLAQGSSVE